MRVRRRESERARDGRVRMMHKEKQSSKGLVVKVAIRVEQMVKVGSVSGLFSQTVRPRCAHSLQPHMPELGLQNTHTAPQHVMQCSTTRYLRYPAARAVPQTPGLEGQQPRECRLR